MRNRAQQIKTAVTFRDGSFCMQRCQQILLTFGNRKDILAYEESFDVEVAYEVSILQQRKHKGYRLETGG
jgi:hypothetical protein